MKFFLTVSTDLLMRAIDDAQGVSNGFKGKILHLFESKGVFKLKEITPFELGSMIGEVLGDCSPGEMSSYTAIYKKLAGLCEMPPDRAG